MPETKSKKIKKQKLIGDKNNKNKTEKKSFPNTEPSPELEKKFFSSVTPGIIEEKKEKQSLSKKEKAKTFFELIRIGNCLMAGIAVLIGFYLAKGSDASLAVFAALAGFLICGAGQAINDYFDAGIDARTSKHRPIPSGRITAKTALHTSLVMFILGIISACLINTATLIIAIIFSILLIAYPLFMNKIKYLGNFVVAGGTAITFVFGAASAGNIPGIIGVLTATAFLSNLGREITKDIEDLRKDLGAKKTLPMLLGTKPSKIFVVIYYLLAAIGALGAYSLFQLNNYYLGFTILSIALFIYSLFLLFEQSAQKSQKISKIAMLLSLIAFILVGL
jgi:geranylgeranylglycerol-phosphate geranylgeranyltransferase